MLKDNKILNKVFSLEKTNRHTILRVLGIKLKIQNKVNLKLYNNFINHTIKPNSILIIEVNNCHYETIPGLCKYLIKLDYNVEVLTKNETEGIFNNILNNKINVWECNPKTFDKISKNFDFTKYERIIYNSKRFYFTQNNKLFDYDLQEYYKHVPKGEKENIYLQHHIDKIDPSSRAKEIILANPSHNPNLEKLVVNTNYFGNVNITPKNKTYTNFISIGELSTKRRNSELLIEAVTNLHNKGLKDFNITIIGRGNLDNLPTEIQSYFNILGRIDYPTMFQYLENSDFILPLLDPKIEAHKRYLNTGTSGTFQLIYGFLKPCIVHKTFAETYGFTEQNALIYNDNQELTDSMQKAISFNEMDYSYIQENLKNTVNKINQNSYNNFKQLLIGD